MTMTHTIFFLLFFFSPLKCMICHSKYPLSLSRIEQGFPKYLKWIEREKQNRCEAFQIIPGEIVPAIMSNLDYKSNVQFMRTCRKFYNNYVNRSDILFTDHYLDPRDYTDAMIHFSRKKDKEKIRLLINHEGEINKKNREQILKWWEWKATQNLENCIINIYNQKYEKDYSYFTPSTIKKMIMHYDNHRPVFQMLFKQGYDLNCQTKWDHHPLEYALQDAGIDYLKALLNLDSQLIKRDIKDKWGGTMLSLAVSSDWEKDPSDKTPFPYGIKYRVFKNIKILKLLLSDLYINCNLQDKYGRSSLQVAVENNNVEAVKLLLAVPDINLNIQDDEGHTPLHHAVRSNKQIVELLMNDPLVDCNIKDNDGCTAYDYATNPEIKELLAERSFINI